MTQSTALARSESPAMFTIAERYFGAERLQVLKAQIAPDATDAELELFAMLCQRSKLDPFAKQIWFYRRRKDDPPIIQASIDGLRLIAERTGQYAGQKGPEFLDKGGQWRDVWIEAGPPVAARVGILRRGFLEPLWSVAVWERAKQTYTVQGQLRLMPLWQRYGPEMLAKTAEARGLKRAFPQETSGLEVLGVPNADDEQTEQVRMEAHARRYDEIFGSDAPPRRLVDQTTGEVLVEGTETAAERPVPEGLLSARTRSDLWADNRKLVARAEELGLTGVPVINTRASEDVLLEANQRLAERIQSVEQDQAEAAYQAGLQERMV